MLPLKCNEKNGTFMDKNQEDQNEQQKKTQTTSEKMGYLQKGQKALKRYKKAPFFFQKPPFVMTTTMKKRQPRSTEQG